MLNEFGAGVADGAPTGARVVVAPPAARAPGLLEVMDRQRA